MKSLGLVVEIVGSCNLRCPSCPNNMPISIENNNPKGIMSPELFKRILEKSTSEIYVTDLGLYNWGEPLLHNKLMDIIDIANSFGLPPVLSSNLNVAIDYDALIAAKPSKIHVSLSGFTQDIYSVAHRGGDIELVKKNMEKLSLANEKYGKHTILTVLYHLYSYNLNDAVQMKMFASDLGFEFIPYWAGWGSLETKLQYLKNTSSIAADDFRFAFSRMPFTFEEALRAIESNENYRCNYQENYIVVGVTGNVQLCCMVFDSTKYSIGNILTNNILDMHSKILKHDLCEYCKSKGLNKYPRNTALIELATKNMSYNKYCIDELFKK